MIEFKQDVRVKLSSGLLFSLAVGVFLITKMIRSFSGSTAAGGIWNYIQIGFVICGLFTIVTWFNIICKDPIVLALLLYTVVSVIHGLTFLEFSRNDIFGYMMTAYPACMLILCCKDSYCKKIEENRIIFYTFYCISAIFIFSMFSRGGYSTTTGAVADVYYILGLLPFMLILTKGKKVIPIAICAIAVVISGKRMGIILCIIMVIVYYLINALQTKTTMKFLSHVIGLFAILLFFAGLIYFINESFNVGLTYRFEKMFYEQDTSGRDEIWSRLIYELKNNTPLVYWITGHGDGAVSKLVGSNAHNDFLEILYNFGVVPFLLYIAFYVRCIIEAIRMIKCKYEYAAQFVISIICSIGLAFVSFYAIAPTYITCGMMCIGYIYIDYRKKYVLNTQPDNI